MNFGGCLARAEPLTLLATTCVIDERYGRRVEALFDGHGAWVRMEDCVITVRGLAGPRAGRAHFERCEFVGVSEAGLRRDLERGLGLSFGDCRFAYGPPGYVEHRPCPLSELNPAWK